MIYERSDCSFFMITKRPERIEKNLPDDWGRGWEHVIIAVTCEDQDMADKSKLIESARKGDEAAMENLTLDEMTLYNKISKRIQTEDVYSIVESSFMPYGMECQRYAIIGKIIDMEMVQNRITGEKCYNLTVECNHITINVGINESDLQGQPEIGRRFKGIVWLQGNIKF